MDVFQIDIFEIDGCVAVYVTLILAEPRSQK